MDLQVIIQAFHKQNIGNPDFDQAVICTDVNKLLFGCTLLVSMTVKLIGLVHCLQETLKRKRLKQIIDGLQIKSFYSKLTVCCSEDHHRILFHGFIEVNTRN